MPAVIIFLLILALKDEKILDQEKYKDMFGVFYEDFEYKRIQGLLYMLIYLLRREIFILVALFM
jgi:hypothetical protein